MKQIQIRENGTKRVATINTLPSKTDQSFKDECDVNNIIAKFNKTGQISHLTKRQGQYADVANIPDLHTASIQVQEAGQAFKDLPAILRKKFNHDPINMIEYLQDPANDEEAVKLGLKVKLNQPEPEPKKQNDDPNDESKKPTS